MFKELFELMSDRDMISITLTKINDKLSVSVIPNKSGLKDEAKNKLTPIVICGTPEEFEEGFIQTVRSPLQKTIGIMTNMAEYEKSVEEMKAKSKETEEAKKKEDAQQKSFNEKFSKVETLFNEKKYSEAALLLKKVSAMEGADIEKCSRLREKINTELNNGTLFQ